MIKKFGLIFFTSIAVFFIWFGIKLDKDIGWQVGGGLLGVIILTVLAVKLFPKQLDSKESGEEGLKILKQVSKRAVKLSDD